MNRPCDTPGEHGYACRCDDQGGYVASPKPSTSPVVCRRCEGKDAECIFMGEYRCRYSGCNDPAARPLGELLPNGGVIIPDEVMNDLDETCSVVMGLDSGFEIRDRIDEVWRDGFRYGVGAANLASQPSIDAIAETIRDVAFELDYDNLKTTAIDLMAERVSSLFIKRTVQP